jgi:hypothetical protein
MRMFGVAVVLAGALLGSVAQAQSPNSVQACAEQGKQQKLRGAQLADFLTKCANTHAAPMPMGDLSSRCRAESQRHALSGEDLNAFMKRCEAGQVMLPATASGPPTCEERARVRALAGEALTAFMMRCQAGQM